jgi:hypothetical protein
VQSQPGEGTRVKVSVPRHADAVVSGDQTRAAA